MYPVPPHPELPTSMSNSPTPAEFKRPFPALTPAQRYHFEAFGYVVVPDVLPPDRCDRINESLHRLREDLRNANPDGGNAHKFNAAFLAINKPHHVFMYNFYDYDDELVSYACDPRLVGMAEEVMGCEARVLEFNAHINRRAPDFDPALSPQFGFHRGVDPAFGSHTFNGLFHCNFVKTLTNLTELGPDDGGTVVIAGSHKLADVSVSIAAAAEDPKFIHKVVASKGSTLLFAESLVHGTGQVRSSNERAIIITGYGPRMYPRWDGGTQFGDNSYPERFAKRVPTALHTLFFGKAHWDRAPRYRQLSDPVDPADYPPVEWPPHPLPVSQREPVTVP